MLQQWRDDLPGSLRMDLGNSTPFIPIFQRQRDVLNYTYWHAVILTNRPLLLKGFNTSEDDGTRIAFEKYKAKIQDGVDKCLQAALSVTNRVCQMFQGGLMFRSFWVGFLTEFFHTQEYLTSLMYTKITLTGYLLLWLYCFCGAFCLHDSASVVACRSLSSIF
jgi:hypothetical protein